MSERAWRGILVVIGATHIALFAWMAFDPGGFFDALGEFGARNDHYIRDTAMFPLAMGVGFLVAAVWPSWRVPVLAVATVWYLAHTVNHLIDINESDAGTQDFVSLLVSTIVFGSLTYLAARQDVEAAGGAGDLPPGSP
jgi:predicted anti-sigma-YlaC factor YlaD